jgi:hypothetical protein
MGGLTSSPVVASPDIRRCDLQKSPAGNVGRGFRLGINDAGGGKSSCTAISLYADEAAGPTVAASARSKKPRSRRGPVGQKRKPGASRASMGEEGRRRHMTPSPRCALQIVCRKQRPGRSGRRRPGQRPTGQLARGCPSAATGATRRQDGRSLRFRHDGASRHRAKIIKFAANCRAH